jgi:hypothetical protein
MQVSGLQMLKYGQQLADEHHVVRYVPPSRLRRDGDDNVLGLLYSALELRESESELSVSWLEYFQGDRRAQVVDCIRLNRKCIVVRPSGAFAIGNVGALKRIGATQTSGRAIKVVFTPSVNNPAHTSIQKLPRDELSLLDTLATEVFAEMVLNSSVPSA